MTGLPPLLRELEGHWRRLGFPVDDYLLPGLDPAEARAVLREVTEEPNEEVVEWFSWHNGCRYGSRITFRMAPYGDVLLPLTEALTDRVSRLEGAQSAAEDELFPADYYWDDAWLPVTEQSGQRQLTVDCAARDGAVVRNVEWSNIDFRTVVAASLSDAVAYWDGLLDAGYYQWSPSERQWECDFASLPLEVRISGLV